MRKAMYLENLMIGDTFSKTWLALFILLVVVKTSVSTQPALGIEFSSSRLLTWNAGELLGGGYRNISNEQNALHTTHSIGFFYRLGESSLLKLSFSKHRNGIIYNVYQFDDLFGGIDLYYYDVKETYTYFQVSPRFVRRLRFGRIIVPVEAGVNLNFRQGLPSYGFTFVDDFNYDLRLATGVLYRINDNFLAGINAVYNHGLSEYQFSLWEAGTFKPRQVGVEFSFICEMAR